MELSVSRNSTTFEQIKEKNNIIELFPSELPPKKSFVISNKRKSIFYPVAAQLRMLNPVGVHATRERVVVAV